jgi:hypothetical protein
MPIDDTGNWIQTHTGKRFHPLAPDPALVDIEDIAHALAMTTRFCGHLDMPYSVAQHSVCVAYLVPPEHALQALLHDGSEAYINDISRPLKRSAQFAGYVEVERRLQAAVYEAFCVPTTDAPEVKHADAMMLRVEAERWFSVAPDWAAEFPALAVPSWYARHGMAHPRAMWCWDWKHAESAFLDTYRKLLAERAAARGTV